MHRSASVSVPQISTAQPQKTRGREIYRDARISHRTHTLQKMLAPLQPISLLDKEVLNPPILRIPIYSYPLIQLPQLLDHGLIHTLLSTVRGFGARIHHRYTSCWCLQLEHVLEKAVKTARGDVVD
jgi:hypothetical protein